MQGSANSAAAASPQVSGERPGRRRLFNVLAAVYLTLLIAPWRFLMPGLGHDWSAYTALAYALVSGWQWGHDIIYGLGPLATLYSRVFQEGTLLLTAIFWILMALALASVLLELLKPVPLPAACVLFLCFALAMTYRRVDTIFFLVPIVAAIGAFRLPRPVYTWKIVLLALLGGVGTLAKLPFGVLSFAIFLLLDVDRVFHKHLPFYVPAFVAALLGGYLLAGQDLKYALPYLSFSASIVPEYGEAMQLWGPSSELVWFLICGAIVGVFFWRQEFPRNRAVYPIVRGALFAGCAGCFLFMIFKQGFARHDLHTITSWDSLGAAGAAYIASVWQRIDSRKTVALAAGAVVFATVYSMRVQAEYGELNFWNKLVGEPVQQVASAAIFIWDHDAWLRHQREQRNATLASIRRAVPLPPLDGPVDSIPAIQSPIIAHGLDYRPRPALHETGAFSGSLITANLEFLRSDRAPRYIIHSAGSIDRRYPSLPDGPLWPELMRLYEPDRLAGTYLVLRRRAAALEHMLSGPVRASARVGQAIAIPMSGPVFVNIRTRKTFLGRIVQFLFKPGTMWLTVKLVDDSVQTYRIIPELVRHGFVLSPLIDDNEKLSALFAGYPELYPKSRVVAFQVNLDALAKFVYEPMIEVEVRRLLTEKLRAQTSATELQSLFRSEFEKRGSPNP